MVMSKPKFYIIKDKSDWLDKISKFTKDGYKWSYDQMLATWTKPTLPINDVILVVCDMELYLNDKKYISENYPEEYFRLVRREKLNRIRK